ncbi:MAG: MFS transporter [Alicyclobacillus sp.]|nr:MFS transporter [Alicyclobacillus sp.]
MSSVKAVAVSGQGSAPRWTPAVLLVLGTAFFTSFSTYMAQPYFVIYYHNALGFSAARAGVLIGITPLCGALFGVVGGYLSDRVGIRRAYCAALLLNGLCLGAFRFLHSYGALLAIAILLGLAMSTTRSGAQALLNVRVAEEHAGAIQTTVYWLNNLAIVIGPPTAALVLRAGTRPTAFLVAGCLLLAMSLLILFFLRDAEGATNGKADGEASAPGSDSKPPKAVHPSFLDAMRWVGANRIIFWTFLALLCYIVLEAQLTSTVPLYMTAQFTHGPQYYGFMNTEVAALALALTPAAARLTKRRSAIGVIGSGVTVLGIGLVVAGFSTHAVGWFIGIGMYGLGEVVAMPKISEVMAGAAGREKPALSFAAINTSLFLGMFVGYTFGAPLFSALRADVLYACAFALALFSIFSFRQALRELQRRRATSAPVVEGAAAVTDD